MAQIGQFKEIFSNNHQCNFTKTVASGSVNIAIVTSPSVTNC